MDSGPPRIVQSLQERLPVAALATQVVCVWVQRVAPNSAPYAHGTVPHGGVELVVPVGSAPRVVGPQTGPRPWVLPGGTTLVGMRLRPGAALAVLGIPADDVVDVDVAAAQLWGRSADLLADRVAAAGSLGQAMGILQEHVRARLVNAPAPDPLAAETVRRLSAGAARIDALARELYVSERQLRRRVEHATGLSPKVLHRVFRFQRFLALAAATKRPSSRLSWLAAEAGYTDQAHLTREAARLQGQTPHQLLVKAGRDCEGFHDHTASYRPLLSPSR